MDPIAVNDPIVNKLRKKVTDLLPEIGEGISLHDFRVVTGPSHTNLIFDMAVPFEIKMTEKEAADRISSRKMERYWRKAPVLSTELPARKSMYGNWQMNGGG